MSRDPPILSIYTNDKGDNNVFFSFNSLEGNRLESRIFFNDKLKYIKYIKYIKIAIAILSSILK